MAANRVRVGLGVYGGGAGYESMFQLSGIFRDNESLLNQLIAHRLPQPHEDRLDTPHITFTKILTATIYLLNPKGWMLMIHPQYIQQTSKPLRLLLWLSSPLWISFHIFRIPSKSEGKWGII